MSSPETPSLAHLHDQIAPLFHGAAHEVQAGHADLGPDIWLSADPQGTARIGLHPAEGGGTVLSLAEADSGGWCCLGMRIPAEALAHARYMGLLVAVETGQTGETGGLLSYTPTLRYHLQEGGHRDVPVAAPVVAAGPAREILSHVPVDHGLREQSRDCEINLFFHTDTVSATLHRLEPLLIL